ncbi:MAG: hypothetical protein J0H14_05220 [Alphaproteobacteria bacterium]|nr:hypothetical protein [Alphaproteobacteria bacterium]
MAAMLTELRSRLLLPSDAPDAGAAAEAAEALRRQPLARARIRLAADRRSAGRSSGAKRFPGVCPNRQFD